MLQQADAIGGAPLLVAAIRLHLQWLNGDGQALIPEILQSATPQQLAAEPTCLLTLSEHARRHNNVNGAVRYDEEALAADLT